MNENYTWGIGGLILGAVIGFTVAQTLTEPPEDEDRPPIIVKNGSLIFESGDVNSNDPEEKPGKPWKQVGSDWQPDHDRGKGAKRLIVAIQGGEQSTCPGLSMTKSVTVTYTSAQGVASNFEISLKPRRSKGTNAPAIAGNGLSPGGTAENPQLVFDAGGTGVLTRVRFSGGSGAVDCLHASGLKIWPLP